MSEDILVRAKRVEYPDSALRILPELIAEVERLRSENNRINKLREAEINQAGAAERVYLEAMMVKDARIADQEAYIERLEAAFLKAEERVLWDEVVVDGPKEGRAVRHIAIVQQKAHEALERIKEGGKDDY